MKTLILENDKLCLVEGKVEVNPVNDAVLWAYAEKLPEVPAGSKLWLKQTKEAPEQGGNAQVVLKKLTQKETTRQAQEIRAQRYQEIDKKTQQAISEGFIYDRQRFSLSQNAQRNWQRLELLHQASRFGASQTISTKDHQAYALKAAKLEAFIQASQAAIDTALAAGRAKKAALGGAIEAV